jgi:hypothetical protein
MRVEQQLSVFLDNKPGSLAAVCEDLTAHDVNIEAITIANLVDHAVVRLIVSDPRAAEHLIAETGALVIVHDVLAVELPDLPGSIERLAHTLGRAKINIDYMYGSSRAAGHGPATVFLRVSDLAGAKRVLTRTSRSLRSARKPPRPTTGRTTRRAR